MPKVTIHYRNTLPFVPRVPADWPRLVTRAGAFPWDLPYVWEMQKELGWPSEIAEADDPLAELTRIVTRDGKDYFNPLVLLEDTELPTWRNVLNAVLRKPGDYRIDDYIEVLNFIRGTNHDPADQDWWGRREFAAILADARALLAILEKYEAKNFIPAPAVPRRGPTPNPDGFWNDMARREEQEGWKREDTITEFANRNERSFVSTVEMQAYVRKAMYDARKRLGIPPKQKNS